MSKRVCVIGGGPAGIMAVAALQDHCEVDCYERANNIGGQWARDTDEMTKQYYGARHSSLYKGLWCNAPKEATVEIANFPFKEARPSFVEGAEISQYLFDYAEEFKVRENIKTFHNVESVVFCEDTDKFSVTVRNVQNDETVTNSYDYVCVATGHFNYPNSPQFPGEDTFSGEVMHAHDFTDGANYAGKRVLCIGGSYSAEDICLLCWKNGAKQAHVSTRAAGGFGYVDWPETVCEKPILTNISNSTVTFADGSTDDYDVIIKCTGYIHRFDFLPEGLQIGAVGNSFVPNGLYKQCISINNGKLFFLGMQNLAYTNSMFQLQAYLLRDTVLGKFTVPDKAGRQAGFDGDKVSEAGFTSVFSCISWQTNYLKELSELTNEAKNDAEHIWVSWVHDKMRGILTFRNENYASVHTGRKAESK